MQATVLVRLGKEPGCVHEIFAAEESGNLLVPERNVSLAVVNDGSQLGVFLEVVHEDVHALDALGEVENLFLFVELV